MFWLGWNHDHRIAMSFAVAGLATKGGLIVDDITLFIGAFPYTNRPQT